MIILELFLILNIIFAILFMPLRGKTFDELSEKKQKRLERGLYNYKRTKKGENHQDMTAYDYLPILQKRGLSSLIWAICLFAVCLLLWIFVYPAIF